MFRSYPLKPTPDDGNPARSLRQRMSQDLQLGGRAQRTRDGYLPEVRKLAAYYKTPDNFLLPEKAASIVYRAKFNDAMREARLLDDI